MAVGAGPTTLSSILLERDKKHWLTSQDNRWAKESTKIELLPASRERNLIRLYTNTNRVHCDRKKTHKWREDNNSIMIDYSPDHELTVDVTTNQNTNQLRQSNRILLESFQRWGKVTSRMSALYVIQYSKTI